MDSAIEHMYEIKLGLSGRGGFHVLVDLNGLGCLLGEFVKWLMYVHGSSEWFK